MDKTWILRDELYRAFHRWPLLLACFACGALLGWLGSYLWPTYIRSDQTIFVGLNPYRTYSDTKFLALARPKYSNLDNYHYWQMSQLEIFIFSPLVLEDTLAALRAQDAYWNQVSAEDLRNMLDAEWRTAGDWNLVAVDSQAGHSRQAIQAWSTASVRQVEAAVTAAQQTFMLDQELQDSALTTTSLERRSAALQTALPALAEARTRLAALPQDQPLEALQRWQMAGLVSSLAGDDPAWQALVSAQPQPGALPAPSLAWLDQVLAQANLDQTQLPAQLSALQSQRQALQEQYQQAQENSWSLSPNLSMKNISEVHTQVVRPASLLAMIGGLAGLLVWIVAELVRINRRGQLHA